MQLCRRLELRHELHALRCMLPAVITTVHTQTHHCSIFLSHEFAAVIALWQMQSRCLLQDLTDEQGAEAVKEAFKQGINFFDTSPYYGVTRSEIVSFLSSLHAAYYCCRTTRAF